MAEKDTDKTNKAVEKEFDRLAKQLRASVDEARDDDFKIALLQAIQNLELNNPPFALQCLQTLTACAGCYYSGNEDGARLLMFVAGTLTNPAGCRVIQNLLAQHAKNLKTE